MNAASIRLTLPRTRAVSALVAVGLAMAALVVVPNPAKAAGFDANAAEQQMLNLVNQDRAANGKPALQLNPALGNIARGGNISVCAGETVHGRSQDMIERNFFSHQIPSCGSAVWPAIGAAGVQYSSAGENIAWNNYSPQATSVDQANTAFMNSAGHKANILGDYNQVGIGAWMASGAWTGNGSPINGVIMYTEIFVNGPISSPPPPPTPTPTPDLHANRTVHMAPPVAAPAPPPAKVAQVAAPSDATVVAAPSDASVVAAPSDASPATVPVETGTVVQAPSHEWRLRPPYQESPENWPGFFF